MIKLETEYYCHDCPFFEAYVEKKKEDGEINTYITCQDALKCKILYKRFTAIDRAASIDPDSCE